MSTLTAEQNFALDQLREHLYSGSHLYTRTDYGRGETDYVRLYVVSENRQILDMTYAVAKLSGRRLTDRGLALRGGNYSKGLEVADDAYKAVYGRPLDQSRWMEIK